MGTDEGRLNHQCLVELRRELGGFCAVPVVLRVSVRAGDGEQVR